MLWDIDLNTHFRRDRVIEVSSSWKLIVPQTREYLKIYVPWHLTEKKQTNKWKQPTHRTFLTPFWCCFVLRDLFNSSLVVLLFIGKYKHHNFLKKTSLKNILFPCVKHFLPHSLFLVLFYQIFVFTSCFFHGQQTIISAICYWNYWSFNSLGCIWTSESKLCISISIYCSFCLIMKDTGGERTAQKASPIFLRVAEFIISPQYTTDQATPRFQSSPTLTKRWKKKREILYHNNQCTKPMQLSSLSRRFVIYCRLCSWEAFSLF